MWFLIRTAFWFSLVLVLLPIFSSQSTSRIAGDPQVQMTDAFSAASGALQYVGAMCNEKPEVCTKGGETLTALGYRAREGARVAYEMLDAQFGDRKGAPAAGDGKAGPAPIDGKGLETAMQSVRIDPVTLRKIQAAALSQTMPAKPEAADAVVTGTVTGAAAPNAGGRSFIPVPTPKPAS